MGNKFSISKVKTSQIPVTLEAVCFSFWGHLSVLWMASPVHSFSSFTWVSLYQTLCGFPPLRLQIFLNCFSLNHNLPFSTTNDAFFFLTCSFCEHWPIQGWISHCSQLDLSSFCWLHAFKFCLLFLPLFLFFFCLFPGTVFLHLSVSHPSCSCQLPLILSLLATSITLVRKFAIILYFPFQLFAL